MKTIPKRYLVHIEFILKYIQKKDSIKITKDIKVPIFDLNKSSESFEQNILIDRKDSFPEIELPDQIEKEEINKEQHNSFKICNYLMNWKKENIALEEKRLSYWSYGPQILIAKNREEYYKFITSRKHVVLRLKKLVELEKKYTVEDNYFEKVKFFKEKLESMGELDIRNLIQFFYYKP